MKKSGILIILGVIILLVLSSCGEKAGDNNNSDAADGDPINGIWTDDNRALAIDTTNGYMDWSGSIYKCDINLKEKTITAKKYSWDDSDVVYNYDLINDKLVLDTDNNKAIDETLSLELSEEKLADSSKLKLDGEWLDDNHDLSLDGDKGIFEWGGEPYKCIVNSDDNTITIKKFSWDDSDPDYSYGFVNGKLLLYTENDKAIDNTMLLLEKSQYDKLPKKEESSEDEDEDKDDYDSDTEENEDESEDDTDDSEPGSVFSPQDVSDKTIESIKTYGDYLTMYKKIIDDYFANYEEAVKGTALYDKSTFQSMKDEMDKSFEEQEKEYGSMKKKKIIGKESLVEFLKDYRDSLKSYTDALK